MKHEGYTPGPWRTGSPSFRCIKPHKHMGEPGCEYTFQGWADDEYFGRFVSSESKQVEIVGSDEHGLILSREDALLIADAPRLAAQEELGLKLAESVLQDKRANQKSANLARQFKEAANG